MKNKKLSDNLIMAILVSIIIIMIIMPGLTYDYALAGLKLWGQVVLPSLLPFFFISEMLLGLNISRFLNRSLAPIIKPLFSLPGCSVLAIAFGFCSGFPSGAVITANLRQKKQISRKEGERLICFTNNAGPLFIFVAISVGILGCPSVALILALVHYGGNLLIGIILGIFAKKKETTLNITKQASISQLNQSLPLGEILNKAIQKSIKNIAYIGCLMIFFSVFTGLFSTILFDENEFNKALFQGFWEMSIGINAIAANNLELAITLPIIAAMLGFGGISIHMQVFAMISNTDISIRSYLISRIIHAIFSYLVMSILINHIALPTTFIIPPNWQINYWSISMILCLGALAICLIIGIFILLFCHLQHYHNN